EPKRVCSSDRDGRGFTFRSRRKHRFFVRYRDVAACEAARPERTQKALEVFGLHRLFRIGAIDAVLAKPSPVNERRTRMRDGPADDTGAFHVATISSPRRRARRGSNGMPRILK